MSIPVHRGTPGDSAWMWRLGRLVFAFLHTSVLVVVAGLLHFPTTCTCGADLPHDHALFLLPHHHHDQHAEVTPEHSLSLTPQRATWSGAQQHAVELHTPELPSSTTSQVAAALDPRLTTLSDSRPLVTHFTDLSRTGQLLTPDPPPPRA